MIPPESPVEGPLPLSPNYRLRTPLTNRILLATQTSLVCIKGPLFVLPILLIGTESTVRVNLISHHRQRIEIRQHQQQPRYFFFTAEYVVAEIPLPPTFFLLFLPEIIAAILGISPSAHKAPVMTQSSLVSPMDQALSTFHRQVKKHIQLRRYIANIAARANDRGTELVVRLGENKVRIF